MTNFATTIKADLFRYGGLSGCRGLIKAWRKPGFRYIYFLRKTQNCRKSTPIWFFYRLLLERCTRRYGFQIPWSTKIGPGFYIGHFGTIVVNQEAIIGKNCNIAHLVTIGQANRGMRKGCPVIGDNVWIGTGAVVVGSITIGSNVLIAPNAYVNIDIPSHSIVVGNPCKIIPKENPCEDYICNTLP